MNRWLLHAVCIVCTALSVVPCAADNFPERPVRIIVTAPPGGTVDFLGRVVAQRMAVDLKQSVIVENRAGASGLLGSEVVVKSAPDGYTVLLTEGAALAINAAGRKDMPFDPQKDLQPLSLVVTTPSILLANPAFPASTVRALVDMATQKPGLISYASPGVGTPHHLAGELLSKMAGIELSHVPYKGGGSLVTDVVGGQVPLMFTGAVGVLPFLKSGKLKAIAVGSRQRMALLPDVPTFAESGYPDFEAQVFFGAFVPAKTPKGVAAVLQSALSNALKDPDVQGKLQEQALIVVNSSPDELRDYFRREQTKWGEIIRSAHVTLE